jgi:hypothetical protein
MFDIDADGIIMTLVFLIASMIPLVGFIVFLFLYMFVRDMNPASWFG